MDLYKPVTLEEYNQTLRDSVNNYYLHANLNMSHEDALISTGQMSERYLNSVEEFNMKAEESENINEYSVVDKIQSENSLEIGEECNEGIGL